MRRKRADGGKGRFAAAFLLPIMAPRGRGDEPRGAIQEELIHDIHVPCFPPQNFIFIPSLCTPPKWIIFCDGINGCLIIFGAWKFVWSIFSA